MNTRIHGVNVAAHIEMVLATERGQVGNEDGYNRFPQLKVLVRSASQRRHGCAWPHRYGRENSRVHLLLNEVPGHDAYDTIETVCHEMAHLLAPRGAHHSAAWRNVYRMLAHQAYGIVLPPTFSRFIGVLAPTLRVRAAQGTLGHVGSRLIFPTKTLALSHSVLMVVA